MAYLDRNADLDALAHLDAHTDTDAKANVDTRANPGPSNPSAVVSTDPVLHVNGLVHHAMLLR